MIYLSLDDLLHIADRILPTVEIRDVGLLESALGRPRASAFGDDAYSSLHAKAAALLHSLATNHGLVDGNKRLALAGVIAFFGMNGWRLTMTNEQAYDLVITVASGELEEVALIAERLGASTARRR